jgi:hypothetical protein
MKNIEQRVSEASRVSPEIRLVRPPFPKQAKIEVASRCDLKAISVADAWHSDTFVKLREAHQAGAVSGMVCADCIACA